MVPTPLTIPAAISFLADGVPIEAGGKVPAGADLKIRGVPVGFTVLLRTMTAPEVVIPLTQSPRDRRIWLARSLAPSTKYFVRITDPANPGVAVSKLSFATRAPLGRVTADISPERGVYGVGVPVEIDFSRAVTNRAAVEAALVVRSDKELGPSSWSWLDSDTIAFRTKKYWPGRAAITVRADLENVEIAPGYFGTNAKRHFRTGAAIIVRTNFAKFRMTVLRDGERVGSFPISGGKPGWETASGVKIVTEKYRQKRLINPDPVIGWNVPVQWAVRLTWNGEFIHSADWNGNIGYANTSHGCTNMRTSDAKTVYDMLKYGDVVESSGTSRPVDPRQVTGEWNTPWLEWLQGSALYEGPATSRS